MGHRDLSHVPGMTVSRLALQNCRTTPDAVLGGFGPPPSPDLCKRSDGIFILQAVFLAVEVPLDKQVTKTTPLAATVFVFRTASVVFPAT